MHICMDHCTNSNSNSEEPVTFTGEMKEMEQNRTTKSSFKLFAPPWGGQCFNVGGGGPFS